MKRMTTDNPQNNFETMMNLVYGKDGWQYIRHGDKAMRTTDFCLMLCKERGCVRLDEWVTEEEKDECLCGCLFEECPIATVYAALSGFGHVRSRLKMYEDAGLEPKWISVEAQLPEDGASYLCHFSEGQDVVCVYYGDGKWLTMDWDDVTRFVTHWMLLPKAPEVEEHE